MAKAERISRIAVTFHVPEGSALSVVDHLLQEEINALFGSSSSRVNLASSKEQTELMFTLELPLVKTTGFMEDFFRKLRRLFARTVKYSPHFTQLPELPGGRNLL